ncbi:glycosyl hydrolases family 18 domain-containing protein [Sarocladium implicatum]|nr:glycosyl hydrolases family 18 domain-containing protein [Sarocladium implicatum]
MSLSQLSTVIGSLMALPLALAAYSPSATDNIAVYWGQNSYGKGSGELAQQRLAHYCANTDIDVIPVAFLNGISPPITNFANAGDNCTAFESNPRLLRCPQLEQDIKECQDKYGKTILLSIGGATYGQGGWPTIDEAEEAADMVWEMFGPVDQSSSVERPFGKAVVDGFDFDFEAYVRNIVPFGRRLRTLMDSCVEKPFYLTSAPQCVYPDAANGPALAGEVFFDFIMIQFYNNYCGINNFREEQQSQNAFNFDVWDMWARNVSANPDVKLLLGIPANTGGGAGYTSGSKLAAAIEYSKDFSSFGGVMLWDMSQLYANEGFLEEVVQALDGTPALPPSQTTSTTALPPIQTTSQTIPRTTLQTSSRTASPPGATGILVPHWGQCGGVGYSGPNQCQPPYTCIGGQWWAACQ